MEGSSLREIRKIGPKQWYLSIDKLSGCNFFVMCGKVNRKQWEPNLKIVLEIASVVIEHDTSGENNWAHYKDPTHFVPFNERKSG